MKLEIEDKLLIIPENSLDQVYLKQLQLKILNLNPNDERYGKIERIEIK